jgi:hypothetical protein
VQEHSKIGRSRPDNKLIDEIFADWYFDYTKLEMKHGFIQWIFPELNRKGSNPLAFALTKVGYNHLQNFSERSQPYPRRHRSSKESINILQVYS